MLSRVQPGELKAALPAEAPELGESLGTILADVDRQIIPAITHWNHPGFFAYFSVSSSAPGILAEMISATLNVNGMLWRTSPAATELETVALGWLRQLVGLPEGLFGVIQDTASASTLVALAAAREAVPGLEARRRGLVGQARLRLYASEQAHSSIEKAAIVLGVGQDGYRRIPVDGAFSDGRGGPRQGRGRGPPLRLDTLRGHGDRGNHVDHQRRSRSGHRRCLRAGGALAPRRRGLCRRRRGPSRVSFRARGMRASRLHRHQPPQVALRAHRSFRPVHPAGPRSSVRHSASSPNTSRRPKTLWRRT